MLPMPLPRCSNSPPKHLRFASDTYDLPATPAISSSKAIAAWSRPNPPPSSELVISVCPSCFGTLLSVHAGHLQRSGHSAPLLLSLGKKGPHGNDVCLLGSWAAPSFTKFMHSSGRAHFLRSPAIRASPSRRILYTVQSGPFSSRRSPSPPPAHAFSLIFGLWVGTIVRFLKQMSAFFSISFLFLFLLFFIFCLVLNFVQSSKFVRISKFVQI
jgi:hypothetical protein